MTRSERVDKLRPFFEPEFGQFLEIDKTSLTSKNKKRYPRRLKGYLKVKPPKGTCFTITKLESLPDIVVCKTRVLSFKIEDLDMQGNLSWNIRTGPQDPGTRVNWRTNIRPGKVVDLNMPWPGPAKPVFTNECIAQHTPSKGRIIYLYFITGERWVIRLPKDDTYINQPKRNPNLYSSDTKVKKVGVSSKKVKPASKIDALLVYQKDAEKYKNLEWVPTWQTFPRNAFEMEADRFSPEGSTTPGLKGKCRYKYSGYRTDRQSGSIECHDVQSYRWVYVPLTCIGDLKIRARLPAKKAAGSK